MIFGQLLLLVFAFIIFYNGVFVMRWSPATDTINHWKENHPGRVWKVFTIVAVLTAGVTASFFTPVWNHFPKAVPIVMCIVLSILCMICAVYIQYLPGKKWVKGIGAAITIIIGSVFLSFPITILFLVNR